MRARRLDPARPYKPLDVGEAGVSASVDRRGRLLYVGQFHPEHGVVALTASAPLPAAARYDQSAVRRHRRRMSAGNAPGFGLGVEGGSAWLLEDALPAVGRGKPELVVVVPHPADADGARGVLQISLAASADGLVWRGRPRAGRAEYPELTEVAPLLPVPEGALGFGWAVARAPRLAALGLGADANEAGAHARTLAGLDPDDVLERALARWRLRWRGWPGDLGRLDAVGRRGIAYVLGCCAVDVADTVCLVTDHRILPLAWTRDAYFVAGALLACGHADLVRRHLDWLFERAERPEGWWARSHLAGGQRKDPVFQLDQQLYPLLELCDYVEATGDRAPLERHGGAVGPVLRAIERRRAPSTALYGTDETPADDPLELPYETANQILLWRTLDRLDRLGVARVGGLACDVAAAVREHQTAPGPDGRPLLAYATDLRGRALLYHDANDLPLALAPAWGFCAPDDPLWRATVEFAFSPANPGFFAGRWGGLGSLHTPAAWPLGHVQQLLVGRATDDRRLVVAGERTLRAYALWDGSLPEASDPSSGRPVSRPWFAWPGAAAAALLARGRLAEI